MQFIVKKRMDWFKQLKLIEYFKLARVLLV